MKHTYSPDVLAVNPGLAAAQKKSRSVTPSGFGRGHSDNDQAYAPAIYPPERKRRHLHVAALHFADTVRIWSEGLDLTPVERRALAVAREAALTVQEAMR